MCLIWGYFGLNDADAQTRLYKNNWITYSPPTLTGAGHQRTVSTNTCCNQWLSLTKSPLKVTLADRNRSMMVCTSKCGFAIITPAHTGVDNQGTTPTSRGHFYPRFSQSQSLVATTAGIHRSLVAHTNMWVGY